LHFERLVQKEDTSLVLAKKPQGTPPLLVETLARCKELHQSRATSRELGAIEDSKDV